MTTTATTAATTTTTPNIEQARLLLAAARQAVYASWGARHVGELEIVAKLKTLLGVLVPGVISADGPWAWERIEEHVNNWVVLTTQDGPGACELSVRSERNRGFITGLRHVLPDESLAEVRTWVRAAVIDDIRHSLSGSARALGLVHAEDRLESWYLECHDAGVVVDDHAVLLRQSEAVAAAAAADVSVFGVERARHQALQEILRGDPVAAAAAGFRRQSDKQSDIGARYGHLVGA